MSEIIATLFERFEGLARLSEGFDDPGDIRHLIQVAKHMQEKDKRNAEATRLYFMAVGNRKLEPVWSFLGNELMDTLDEAYVTTLQRTGRAKLSEAEMLFTNLPLRNSIDRSKMERAMKVYQNELFQKLNAKWQEVARDPTRTAFEKAL